MHRARLRLLLLCLSLGLPLGLTGAARAQTTTERGASILLFPKLVADSSADTIVQLNNASGSRANVFCSYVDGSRGWAVTSFAFALQPAQPVLWTASRGRSASADGSLPAIPAAPAGLHGELLCVEVDPGGAPTGDDRLLGHATVVTLPDGDAAGYAAFGLRGSGFFNDSNEVLCIGGESSDVCLTGPEYDACPAEWILNHPAEGAADDQLGAGSALTTRLTIAPCTQNVRDAGPASVRIAVSVTNAFEQHFSAAADVTCWADLSLADIGGGVLTAELLGGDYATTTLRPADGQGGFVVLGEVARRASPGGPIASRAALPPHRSGAAAASDVITLPMGRP